ncbi:hypothetical protein T484DRAFT_2020377, partial [Baffinella frigidus]
MRASALARVLATSTLIIALLPTLKAGTRPADPPPSLRRSAPLGIRKTHQARKRGRTSSAPATVEGLEGTAEAAPWIEGTAPFWHAELRGAIGAGTRDAVLDEMGRRTFVFDTPDCGQAFRAEGSEWRDSPAVADASRRIATLLSALFPPNATAPEVGGLECFMLRQGCRRLCAQGGCFFPAPLPSGVGVEGFRETSDLKDRARLGSARSDSEGGAGGAPGGSQGHPAEPVPVSTYGASSKDIKGERRFDVI